MKSFLLLLFASLSSVTLVRTGTPTRESQAPAIDLAPDVDRVETDIHNAELAQDPLLMGIMQSSDGDESSRHRQEKAHLLKRMDKNSGKWRTSHPRYRLLEALWAYTRYRERHMAELDRWRSLYKSVSKKQKKVGSKRVSPLQLLMMNRRWRRRWVMQKS
jgi:carnosine N-methyltransferase